MRDVRGALGPKLAAEACGTGFLVAVVVGSGIAAQRLSPGQPGLQLLENAAATAAGLAALILALGPVSGAHFNPVVTLAERAEGGMSTTHAAAYISVQVTAACVGAASANVMFGLDPIALSTTSRGSGGVWFAEALATFGLLVVILGVARSGRAHTAAVAVAAYIAAAYWFTSSTSFANPAVTVGRTLSDSFAGIRWTSAPAFVAAQVAGASAAVAFARYVYPPPPPRDLVVPHDPGGAPLEPQDRPSSSRPGTDTSGRLPVVLFLCVHNAGRSQMALGWFNHLAAGRAVAYSGGSEPADAVSPVAVAAMTEVGIDIAREFPKPWTDEAVRAADVVVTMGCGDTCPFFPGKRYEDWPLEDPAGQGIDAVRPIRDEIEGRVRDLLESLGLPAA